MPNMVEITKASKERRLEALRLRRTGLTYAQIGKVLGIGKQYAHTLVRSGERIEQRRAELTENASDR